MSLVERPDEELLIFELKIGDILLSEALITYEDLDTGEYYIPLSDFFYAVQFPINVNNDTGIAQGWSIDENTTFALSLPQKKVTLRGSDHTLKKGSVENHSDGIYVSLKALENWFPVTIDVNFSNLAIIISSLQPLPIENRLERDKARNQIGSKEAGEQRTNTLEKPNAPRFTLPFIDTSLQSSYTNRNEAQKAIGLRYSATARSIVLGQDALYTINDQTDDNESPNFRLTVGRKAFEGEKLAAGLSEYAVGDVTTYDMPLIADSSAGRGLFFTNISPFKNSLGGSDTVTLRGNLSVGYQVDIKRNGELLNFIEEPDENGEYVFEDLFVLPGLNIFELVFYGPQGQEIVEEKRIFVPENPVEKGAFEYRVHAIQDNTNLFTNRDDSNEDTGELRFTGEASYGISHLSSIRAGAATYSLDGEQKQYGLVGFSTSWKGLRFDANQAASKDGNGSSLRVESAFKGFRWQAIHEYFNNFISEENDSSGLTGDLEHKSDVRISGMLPFLFLRSVPLTLQATRLENTNKDEQYEWSLRATKNIKHIRITTELDQTIPPVSVKQTDLNFQISSRLKDVTLRGTARFALEPETELESINLTSDIVIDDATKLRLGLSRSGVQDPLHTFTVGLNRDLGFAQAGLNTIYDDTGNITALLSASFGFAYDSLRRKPYFSSKRLSNSSAVFANVYRDLDADNIIDDDEPYLENVGFTLAGSKKQFITQQDGTVFIPELRSYERSTIEIQNSTLPNPFMQSKPRKIDYLMRPSQTHTHDYPVILTGEVDGEISILKKGSKVPASSITLDILRPDGSLIISGKSEFDGFFFIQDVPIGNHIIRPNAQQLEELGYCPVTERTVTLDEQEPFHSVSEPFLLHPDPRVIDENRWIILDKNLLLQNALLQKEKLYDFPSEAKVKKPESEGVLETAMESIDVPENLPKRTELSPLMPRYTISHTKSDSLFHVISGPYKDLDALQTCTRLKDSGHDCLGIIRLRCEDFKNLNLSNPTDS